VVWEKWITYQKLWCMKCIRNFKYRHCCDQVLVFMVVSLNKRRKPPVEYILLNKVEQPKLSLTYHSITMITGYFIILYLCIIILIVKYVFKYYINITVKKNILFGNINHIIQSYYILIIVKISVLGGESS